MCHVGIYVDVVSLRMSGIPEEEAPNFWWMGIVLYIPAEGTAGESHKQV